MLIVTLGIPIFCCRRLESSSFLLVLRRSRKLMRPRVGELYLRVRERKESLSLDSNSIERTQDGRREWKGVRNELRELFGCSLFTHLAHTLVREI